MKYVFIWPRVQFLSILYVSLSFKQNVISFFRFVTTALIALMYIVYAINVFFAAFDESSLSTFIEFIY